MNNQALSLTLSANKKILSLHLDHKQKEDLAEAIQFYETTDKPSWWVIQELTEIICANSEYTFVDDLSSLGFLSTKSAFVTFKENEKVDELWIFDSDIYDPAHLLFRDGYLHFYSVHHN